MADSNVDDLRLPVAVINRIIKEVLPPNAVVSKEARIAISRAAAVFIINVTSFANDSAVGQKRKTVTAPDVLQAIRNMDCEQLEEPLREAVELWKSSKNQKSEEAKKRRAEKAKHPAQSSLSSDNVADIEDL